MISLVMTMLLNPLQACQGSPTGQPCQGPPTLQEEYRGNYVPNVTEAWHGAQIVAPNTPYVAAAGHNKLYFLDTRLDAETAQHIKDQIEWASVPSRPTGYTSIDEIEATAEVRDSATGETLFVFDPKYTRVLFAKGINRHNPDIKLPEPEWAGDWLVSYDLDALKTGKKEGVKQADETNIEI